MEKEMYRYSRLEVSSKGLERFRALNRFFAEVFDMKEAYLGNPPSDEYLLSLLQKPHIIPVVADYLLQDGEGDARQQDPNSPSLAPTIVGGLVAYMFEKFEQDRRELYIYDLGVDKAHRRRGVASNLILKTKEIAKELGAYIVLVQADQEDWPPIRLYEKFGAREDIHHFEIKVD